MMKDGRMIQEEVIEYLPEKNDMGHIEIPFETPIGEGAYTFTVQPIHDNCRPEGCRVSQSPKINFGKFLPLLFQ